MSRLRAIDGPSDLLETSAGDPFLRWEVDPAEPLQAWADDDRGTIGLIRRSHRWGNSLVVLGEVAAARRTAADLLSVLDVRGLTLPRAGDEDPSSPGCWDWMWTTTAPPSQPGEEALVRLDDPDEVAALLAEASPRHSRGPYDPSSWGWFGLRDPDGSLIACGTVELIGPDIPHLASIATRPDRRGRGLGATVTAGLTRRALAEGSPAVTLGVYADNAVARRLYQRLGFRLEWQFSSGDAASHPGLGGVPDEGSRWAPCGATVRAGAAAQPCEG